MQRYKMLNTSLRKDVIVQEARTKLRSFVKYQDSSVALGIKEAKTTEDKIQKISEAGNDAFETLIC